MRKKILTILMMLIMVTSFTNVNAISSDEVLYNHEGQDEEVTESLNKLYDDLNICYSTGDATANQILAGHSAYVKGNIITGTIPNVTTYSYKPQTVQQTIPKGSYIDKDITIEGDANLAAGNIKAGTSIFGVLGTFTNDGTATAAQMLNGVKAYVKGALVTGNIQNQGATTISPSKNAQTIKKGKYIDQDITIKGDNNLVAGNIKQGVSIFGVSGTFTNDGTATASQMLSGAKAYVKGALVTGNIQNQGVTTISPSKSAQTIKKGKYIDQDITINGDNNLVAGNIKQGVSIFGVAGTFTNDGTAISAQMLSGAKAYVKGALVTGNIQNQGATTITPGKNSQTINSGKYLNQNITISGDNNLVAGNIKCGVSIFGTQGNYKCLSGLAAKAKVGQYVRMTPTASSFTIPASLTGYSQDQIINPSELALWRILRINDDGTIEMTSEYLSSTAVFFKGETGYRNYVATLNLIASSYTNLSYTISSRYFGYAGQASVVTGEINYNGGMMYDEYWAANDLSLVEQACGSRTANVVNGGASDYWVSSRGCWSGVCHIYATQGTSFVGSSMINSTGGTYSPSHSLRPIVILKNGIDTSIGNGSSGSPWVLG